MHLRLIYEEVLPPSKNIKRISGSKECACSHMNFSAKSQPSANMSPPSLRGIWTKVTNDFVKKIDDALSTKEGEIMQV